MNKKLETAEMDELLRAILSLETVEEAYEFFEDLCTVNEMVAMKQRFEVAKMLREERTYQDIADETGASSATISRVNRALNYGNDGYDLVLKRIGQKSYLLDELGFIPSSFFLCCNYGIILCGF